MTLPSPIQGFLDEFEHALKLSGRRRRRVLDEVRDHLIDATERGIGAGMDPAVAEVAAVDAFGDADTVASRFDRHFLARVGRRISAALDNFDRWRAIHTTAAATFLMAPLALPMAVLWSPLVVLSFIGPWAAFVWIGRQLGDRDEPGYRYRLWGWKGEHPGKYQVAINLGGFLGFGSIIAVEFFGRLPHLSPWLLVVLPPLYPVVWILNSPRRYHPPPVSAA
jgi:hypothetical protein